MAVAVRFYAVHQEAERTAPICREQLFEEARRRAEQEFEQTNNAQVGSQLYR